MATPMPATTSTNFDHLPLHPSLHQLLRQRGILHLYLSQLVALEHVLSGKNILLSIPTASGKTLVAELLALQILLQNRDKHPKERSQWGKILYLCPLKALGSEKFKEFHDDWLNLGFRVGMSRSDIDQPDFHIFQNDLVILTNEKADSLYRLNSRIMKDVIMVIVDEIHLITDPKRGITLEFLLTRMLTQEISPLLVGLSATIRNAHQLATWLRADLITSTWRPVPLKEGYYLADNINFQDGSQRRVIKIPGHDDVTSLTLDMLKEGGQVLIFANSRKSAMSQADQLSPKVRITANETEKQLFSWVHHEFETKHLDDTYAAKKLAKVLKGGVAFHHAGMGSDQLHFIVDQYNAGHIKVICCTPTLAAGVNTPARRVIIKTLYRYEADKGSVLIPIMEYKQMAGRAGRPRYDPYGEVVILGSDPRKLEENGHAYIHGEIERISSKLEDPPMLQSQTLSLVVSQTVNSREALNRFINHTFYYHQHFVDSEPISEEIESSKLQTSTSKKKDRDDRHRRVGSPRKGGRGRDPLGLPMDDSEEQHSHFPLLFTSADKLLDSSPPSSEDNSASVSVSHSGSESDLDRESNLDFSVSKEKGSSCPPPTSLPDSSEISEDLSLSAVSADQTQYVPYPSSSSSYSTSKSTPVEKSKYMSGSLDTAISDTLTYFIRHDLIMTLPIEANPVETTSPDPLQPDLIPSDFPRLFATPFGKITNQSYLLPTDAVLLREDLAYAKSLEHSEEIEFHPVSWLHLLTTLHTFPKYYLRNGDYSPILAFIEQYGDNLIMEQIWEPVDPEFPEFAKEIKMTMILWDWISEIPGNEIAERYNVGRGDVHRIVENACWCLRGLQRIEKLEGDSLGEYEFEGDPMTGGLYHELLGLETRLRYGIRAVLLPFIEFHGIGRIRARKLYQAGYKSREDLTHASHDDLAKIPLIGDHLATQIIEQLASPKSKSRRSPSGKSSSGKRMTENTSFDKSTTSSPSLPSKKRFRIKRKKSLDDFLS
ncbi:MAG: DEAD/DEAH box helicase [Promethearchaeota archaeon]|nr:MAG: DEAD/DEAH box helicase [Candidatus Lokiarchaeota archaeon]